MKAKIFYFTLQDEQTREEKLDWFDRTRFEQIPLGACHFFYEQLCLVVGQWRTN